MDEWKGENYIPVGINAGGITSHRCINLLILTDLFYLYIRNLFLAMAHTLREYSILRDAITEDDDDDEAPYNLGFNGTKIILN